MENVGFITRRTSDERKNQELQGLDLKGYL
jgi:hypothetical protein